MHSDCGLHKWTFVVWVYNRGIIKSTLGQGSSISHVREHSRTESMEHADNIQGPCMYKSVERVHIWRKRIWDWSIRQLSNLIGQKVFAFYTVLVKCLDTPTHSVVFLYFHYLKDTSRFKVIMDVVSLYLVERLRRR